MNSLRIKWALVFCSLVTSVLAQSSSSGDPLGWRLGCAAWSFNRFTLMEAVEKTAELGLHYIEAFEGQRLSPASEVKVGVDMPAEAIEQLRRKLASANVKLTSVYIHSLPGDEPACRRAFEFCGKLGIQTIVSEPEPEALNVIERLCDEYRINVAIHNHAQGKSRYWHPQEVLKVCEGRSPRIGACADLGHWQRSGIKPVDAVRLLGSRLLSFNFKDLNAMSPDGHDVPWGTGKGEVASVLHEVHRLGIQPAIFAIEYEYHWEDNTTEIAQCVDFFRRTAGEIGTSVTNQTSPLMVGWATADITPKRPVALIGQLHKRISTGVRDPLTATVLCLETPGGSQPEQAILVSCDLLLVQRQTQKELQERVRARLPEFDSAKLFLNATHTHTGPGLIDSTFKGLYDVSQDAGVMKASEYAQFFLEQVTEAVVQAWKSRKAASVGWAATQAAVGHNRRAQFRNGSTVMYGNTQAADFAYVEGPEDHAVNLVYFWDAEKKWSGVVVNVACPAQETEHLYEVSADFWHDVREELHRRHGKGLFILPQCAPAGDLSPHLIYRQRVEQTMDQRRGLSRRKEIARRIANAVDEALPVAAADCESRMLFRHTVASAQLPEQQPPAEPFYETDSVQPIEFHVLRLGDISLATCPFELYVDYGIRIQARSPAAMTLLVQLSSGNSGYLPTARAVAGGGYSADKFRVGPEGGQVLVEETVKQIQTLFP
ncbi:MAG TPA: sugar phosphate isomerase/epimerase family protein [Clostridia bacterium]|nr:sugar phosphate isomerase/epimerase family protein [Clostridia bacterium]